MPKVEFSVFPSVYWAEKDPLSTAIIWEKGDSTLLSFLPQNISWTQFGKLIEQSVNFLNSLVEPNTLVAYLGTHRLIGVLCYCSVIASGRRILMLNPTMSDVQCQQIIKDNGVSLLLTDENFIHFIEADKKQTSLTIDPYQPATFTLTSGSSGSPKAVVHTIDQHLANAESVCHFMQFRHDSTWLLSLPLFHVSGQGIIWRWLYQGATLYLVEDKTDLWRHLSQVSHTSLVPTQLQRYLIWLGDKRVSQHILLGGATIPAELIQKAQQNGMTTYAGYGMTEMASTICAVKNESNNVGVPLANREVRLVEGEIWVRGKSLALGYWQQGKIKPFTNAQGWFATKDKGRWNTEGKLEVLGRLDNMFISGGENIQPEEVEKILQTHPLVKQIFIVPVSDDEFGERPVALIELTEQFSVQAVKLLENFAKQQLEKFKLPIAYLPFESEQWQSSGIKVSRMALKAYVEKKLREKNA